MWACKCDRNVDGGRIEGKGKQILCEEWEVVIAAPIKNFVPINH